MTTIGIGLGIGFSGAVGISTIPLSFWLSGGYWDLSALPGNQADQISTTLASQIGANVLTPSSTVKPQVWDNAVGGNRAAHFTSSDTGANETYYTSNNLAALFQGTPTSFVVAMHFRQTRLLDMPLWSVLRGDGASNEQLWGRQTAEKFQLRKNSAGGGLVTKIGRSNLDPYGDMIVIWILDSGNISIFSAANADVTPYVDALGAYDVNSLSAGLNRFTAFSSVSSVPFEGANGYLGKLAVSSASLAGAGYTPTTFAAQLVNQWRASNYLVKQAATGRCVSIPGDSETLGAQDTVSNAGRRGMFAQFCYDNALSLYTVSTSPGVRAGSGIGNTFSSSFSSQTIANIQASAVADLAAAPTPVRFADIMAGDGDNNAGTATATMMASMQAMYIAVLNAGIARDPNFRIAVSTLPPISPPGGTIDLGVTAFNGAIGAVWNTIDGLYPSNKLFRWDAWRALGQVWSALYFGADPGHPNRLGLLTEALHTTYGLFRASDGSTLLGNWLRANSPTAAKPVALTCAITFPAPAATLPNGTPVTITGTCSRLGANVVVTLASQNGSALWTETYTVTTSFGGNDTTSNPQWALTVTPPAGDIGARTITAVATDIDGTTTASATGVAVTVT